MAKPKVSALVVTYNHEKFIGECLDSILTQKTSFPVEILVGDDASTDNTQQVLREYQAKNPERIRLILHSTNFGDIGKLVWTRLFAESQGEYVHGIEGDDYWINENKLQMQAEVLDAHPGHSICFHNTRVVFDGVPQNWPIPDNAFNPYAKEEYSLDDLIGEHEKCFIHASSMLFRRSSVRMPEWLFRSKSSDIPFTILLAEQGPIRYIPEFMSVYRKHAAGLSFTDDYNAPAFLENRIQMYEDIDRELGYRFHARIRKTISRYYVSSACCSQHRDNDEARAYYLGKAKELDPQLQIVWSS